MIRRFVTTNPKQWDVHLPLLTVAYQSTIHAPTGFTPNLLMLGGEVNLPVVLLIPRPKECEDLVDYSKFSQELQENMEDCYELACKYLQRSVEWQKRDTDLQILQNNYHVGDLVYTTNLIKKKLE